MNLKHPLKLFLSDKSFQELDFAICLCSCSYHQPVGSHIDVVLHHVISCHNIRPFSLPSPIIAFNVAYSSYKREWLNMEEVLEMGTKPEQKDAPSPQVLPAKPLEEIQPFFFAPLFALSLPALISVQLIPVLSAQPCPACILPCAVGCAGFWGCGNHRALMLEGGGMGAGTGTVHHLWKADGSGGQKGNVSPEHHSTVLPGAWEDSP